MSTNLDHAKYVQGLKITGLGPMSIKDALVMAGFTPTEARDLVLTHWDDEPTPTQALAHKILDVLDSNEIATDEECLAKIRGIAASVFA